MKSLIKTVILVLLFSAVQTISAQTLLTVHGFVSNLNNQPIAGKMVIITVDSTIGPIVPFAFTTTLYTDPSGHYMDTIQLPAGVVAAMVKAQVIDCNNVTQYNFQWFNSPIGVPPMNFTICDNTGPAACHAHFSGTTNPNSLQVTFSDLSAPSTGSSITSWFWSFGDSTFSTLQNPVHTYAQNGTYSVCLTIADGLNCSSTSCQAVWVSGSNPGNCTAGFTPLPGSAPGSVSFINTSSYLYLPAIYNALYIWNFGDNTSDTSINNANINHTYAVPGTYQVCLTQLVINLATNTVVCQSNYCNWVVAGNNPPQTGFTILGHVISLNNQPIAGKVVHIQIDSVNGIFVPFSYNNTVLTDPNGFFIDSVFLPAGATSAMVKVWVFDCNNVAHYLYQWVIPPLGIVPFNFNICNINGPVSCNAAFLYNTIPNALLIAFSDLSTPSSGGSITSWLWSFGDSTYSTLQNPTHTYAQNGVYHVCLTITDSLNCSSTHCQPVQVANSNPGGCFAGFAAMPVLGSTAVNFINTSNHLYMPAINNILYFWDFGDNTIDTTNNNGSITHLYTQPGMYQVCITMLMMDPATSNVICQSTWCDLVPVGGIPQPTGFLHGTLSANNSAAGPCVVYLIYLDPLIGALTVVDTTLSIDSSGVTSYFFPNIIPGSYLVKAAMLPSNPNYGVNMPTYHQSALYWNQAAMVNVLPNGVTNANISFIQGINPGGPGFIGGLIFQGANKGPGDPIEGVQVMLLDVNNNDNPVEVAFSDATGHFEFNNIPFGTYKVYAEMINKTTHPAIITIDAANPSTDGIQIIAGSTVISSIQQLPEGLEGQVGNISPNPVEGYCTLQISLEKNTSYIMEIIDFTGQIVRTEKLDLNCGNNTINIDTHLLSSGIYLVSLTARNGVKVTRKLVKR